MNAGSGRRHGNEFDAFNSLLVERKEQVNLIDYITEFNRLHTSFIDISFMHSLLDYMTVNECCIPHTMLVKYGVISDIKSSGNTLRMLNQYEMVEGTDFKRVEVDECIGGKTYHAINFYLHPDAFKMCLIRSKNTQMYAKYYIFMEKAAYYYNQYQYKMKDNKYSIIVKKLDKSKKRGMVITAKFEETNAELIKTNMILESIMKKLENCVNLTSNCLRERFVVLQNKLDVDQYYVLRRQKKSMQKGIEIMEEKGYKPVEDLVDSQYIPNSIMLWNVIKTVLSSESKIRFYYNTFKLVNMTDKEFKDIVISVFNSRKDVN